MRIKISTFINRYDIFVFSINILPSNDKIYSPLLFLPLVLVDLGTHQGMAKWKVESEKEKFPISNLKYYTVEYLKSRKLCSFRLNDDLTRFMVALLIYSQEMIDKYKFIVF